MRTEEFQTFQRVLKNRSGLTLTEDKEYLLKSRLEPVARRYGKREVGDLAQMLKAGNERVAHEVAEAMTTNESSFFRDQHPFDQLRDTIIPWLMRNRTSRRLRIWSAACAKGQEPLSIAMLLEDNKIKIGNPDVEIVATDISREMIDLAREGRFSDFEVNRCPSAYKDLMKRYFTSAGNGVWKPHPSVHNKIRYEVHNLLNGCRGGPYDIVFCRNVLLYFDADKKRKAIEDIARVMAADGALFLGGAETTMGLTNAFVRVPDTRGVYTPKGSPLASTS